MGLREWAAAATGRYYSRWLTRTFTIEYNAPNKQYNNALLNTIIIAERARSSNGCVYRLAMAHGPWRLLEMHNIHSVYYGVAAYNNGIACGHKILANKTTVKKSGSRSQSAAHRRIHAFHALNALTRVYDWKSKKLGQKIDWTKIFGFWLHLCGKS